VLAALWAAAIPLPAQQPDPFRWMDFHSAKDQSVISWVTRSLAARSGPPFAEIGVQYDAALVVTTRRAGAQSLPGEDTYTVWNTSLTSHGITPLITGANLRFAGWMRLAESEPEELAALYDSCAGCAADTYFTNLLLRPVAARLGGPVDARRPDCAGVEREPAGRSGLDHVYAAIAERTGGSSWPPGATSTTGGETPEDFLYRYDLDASADWSTPNRSAARTPLP